ncbi:hypothetical protein E4J89_17855 [Arthrobacter sp. CAU 1506]|uniref:hypothetical protein n=1 Tax=Arthrobacter sp. CAU 1506 TaxID=2560052 RepID=UPI0010AD6E8C|nr:hypothetical protein [Arthrobacter sp. CAU 1506]TJY66141.1 hypothetical protein E4J89_17855 [Arthrobacter sp. CAU 1506]
MTELAYMTREAWAQGGTLMVPQSAVIRDWLGEPPYVFAASDIRRLREPNSADMEFIDYVAFEKVPRQILGISELRQLAQQSKRFNGAVTVLHPYEQDDCELLRKLVTNDEIERLFVVIWSPSDMVRNWLDGMCARNLDTGSVHDAPDSVQLEAAKCMVDEQYNGLSTGNGKAAVVQLIRAFAEGGYLLEKEPWLKAFFAAGGEFRHAESISKLISEMKKGTRHRVQQRYRLEILSILQGRASAVSADFPG